MIRKGFIGNFWFGKGFYLFPIGGLITIEVLSHKNLELISHENMSILRDIMGHPSHPWASACLGCPDDRPMSLVPCWALSNCWGRLVAGWLGDFFQRWLGWNKDPTGFTVSPAMIFWRFKNHHGGPFFYRTAPPLCPIRKIAHPAHPMEQSSICPDLAVLKFGLGTGLS